MKRLQTAAALCLGLGLVGGALARDTSAKSSATKQAVEVDHDFGCALSAADLKPWDAKGLRVPAASKAHFNTYKRSAADIEKFLVGCTTRAY